MFSNQIKFWIIAPIKGVKRSSYLGILIIQGYLEIICVLISQESFLGILGKITITMYWESSLGIPRNQWVCGIDWDI